MPQHAPVGCLKVGNQNVVHVRGSAVGPLRGALLEKCVDPLCLVIGIKQVDKAVSLGRVRPGDVPRTRTLNQLLTGCFQISLKVIATKYLNTKSPLPHFPLPPSSVNELHFCRIDRKLH